MGQCRWGDKEWIIHLHRLRTSADFSPRHSFIRPGTRVGPIKFLTGVLKAIVSIQVVIDNASNIRCTRKNLHRYATDQELASSTGGGKLDAYNKHRVGDLVFTHSTPKNDHPSFSRRTCEFVQITDVLHNIDYETRRPERVKI